MSDIPNFNNLANYRFNSFNNTITPKKIGYGVNSPEIRTIPNTGPYLILLHEAPQLTTPSTVIVYDVDTSTTLIEVSKTTVPGNNQFRVNYDERGLGQVEFNANQKGHLIWISYYGIGSLNKIENYQATKGTTFPNGFIKTEINVVGTDIYIYYPKLVLEAVIGVPTFVNKNTNQIFDITTLDANTWYAICCSESTEDFSVKKISDFSTPVGNWDTSGLANNQLDMFNSLYDFQRKYCRAYDGTIYYRIIGVVQINNVSDNTDFLIKIDNIPKTKIIAYNSISQAGVVAGTLLQFPNIELDINSEYDNTTYTFTSKFSKFLNWFSKTQASTSGDLTWSLKKNTTIIDQEFHSVATGDSLLVRINYNCSINKDETLKQECTASTAAKLFNPTPLAKGTVLIINEY